MVELVLKITSAPSGIQAMVDALQAVSFKARLQHACVECRLFVEVENPRSLWYVEQWSSLAELEAQLQSECLGMVLAIMETAPEAPELEVRTISDLRGLEYVTAVRLSSDREANETSSHQERSAV